MSDNKDQTVFILKSADDGFASVEQFLKNRDWDVQSTSDMKGAVPSILRAVPTYVLLGVDHPSPRIRSMPRMLAQAVPSVIILFSESSDQQFIDALRIANAKYTLYPPISGPAVERMLLRIQKDEEDRLKLEESERRRKLIRPMSAASTDNNDLGYVPKQQEGYSRTNLYSPQFGGSEDPSDRDSRSPSAEGAEAFGSEKAKNKNAQEGDSVNINESGVTMAGKPDTVDIIEATGAPIAGDSEFPRDESSVTAGSEATGTASEQSSAASGSVEPEAPESVVEKVQTTSHLLCITLKSGNKTGFLLAALGKNRPLKVELASVIRESFFKKVQESEGAVPSIIEVIEVQVKPVDFMAWIADEAEHFETHEYEEKEIAYAYFKSGKTFGEISKADSNEMSEVALDDISTNTVLIFSLHLRLSKNSKMIRYTAPGRPLLKEQKDRLLDRGLESIFIQKSEITNFKRHRLESYLNSKILEYQAK